MLNRAGGAGGAFTEHGGTGVSDRPGVRRKVCFTDETRFWDSTEGTIPSHTNQSLAPFVIFPS